MPPDGCSGSLSPAGSSTRARYTTSGRHPHHLTTEESFRMEESAALPPSLEDVMLGPKQGGTEVYLIRHAGALPDAAEVVLGHYDQQSLSELGRKQAQALAAGLREVQLAAVYSAPLGRARQTEIGRASCRERV